MTDEQILEHIRNKNPNGSQGDVDAFRRLMKAFDCEDSETPEEGFQRILASLDALSKDLESEPDELKQRVLVATRLRGFRKGCNDY